MIDVASDGLRGLNLFRSLAGSLTCVTSILIDKETVLFSPAHQPARDQSRTKQP